ncbi:hypothetical protein ACHAWF_006961 [Thalassiosira exigua]
MVDGSNKGKIHWRSLAGGAMGIAALALAASLASLQRKLAYVPHDVRIRLSVDEPRRIFRPISSLTDEQRAAYERDGAILVRGLLSPQDAARLREEVTRVESRTTGLLDYLPSPAKDRTYEKVVFDAWRTNEAVASLSLEALPPLAAQLLGVEEGEGRNNDTLRLLRDGYFRYASAGKGCGWHVDDVGFWPASPDSTGVTAWIALDEMIAREGGGLAVANMSLAAELADDVDATVDSCLRGIRANGTCDMETKSPECQRLFDAAKMEWDLRPGDAILWDRWTFHRGVPASTSDRPGGDKLRYSVRYVPGQARAMGMVHESVRQGEPFDSPYYPQVWPVRLAGELEALERGLEADANIGTLWRIGKLILTKKARELLKW